MTRVVVFLTNILLGVPKPSDIYSHTLSPLASFFMLAFSLRPKIKNKPPFSGQINGGAAWPRDLIQRSTEYWVKVSNFLSQAALKSNTSRWDDSKLSSEERLNFATCLTFCVQTTFARVATLPLSTLVSSLQCSYYRLSSITFLCSFVRPYVGASPFFSTSRCSAQEKYLDANLCASGREAATWSAASLPCNSLRKPRLQLLLSIPQGAAGHFW